MPNSASVRRLVNTFLQKRSFIDTDMTEGDLEDSVAESLIDAREAKQEGEKLLTPSLFQVLRRAFGPRAVEIFQFYRDLRSIQLGLPVPSDLAGTYQKLVRTLANVRTPGDGKKLSPPVKDLLFKSSKRIIPKLQAVLRAYQADPEKRGGIVTWRPIIEQLSMLLETIARDKRVYIKIGRYLGTGGVRWPVFYKMRAREEALQRLADEDPETFASVQRLNQTIQVLDARAVSDIEKDGLVADKKRISGRWVNIGVNEETKRALDELRNKQATLRKSVKKTDAEWQKWWRTAITFEMDSEDFTLWVQENPEPVIVDEEKLAELRRRWERTKPKDDDPIALEEWEAAEPSIENLREQVGQQYKSYDALREAYKANAEEMVYDHDGTRIPMEEFRKKNKATRQTLKELASDSLIEDTRLDNMRIITEEDLEKVDVPVKSMSLTDDDAKKHRLTKVFSVKSIPVQALLEYSTPQQISILGRTGYSRDTLQVVTSGRYAGIPVDHLVNENGRLLERTEYIMDRKKGVRSRPKRDPTGYDQTQREPFVTVAEDGRLFISVSGTKKWRKVVDQLLAIGGFINEEGERTPVPAKKRRLATPPGFEKDALYYSNTLEKNGEQKRRGQYGFFFTPENFGLVQEKIGSLALSEGASKYLEDYFDDLTRAEKATEDQNLAPFAHHNLGGFKDWVLNETGEEWLKEKQKYESLQRQHGEDPRAEEWAQKAQEFRDKLNRPKELLAQRRKLEDALAEKPGDPRAIEWSQKLAELKEIFRKEQLGGFEFQMLGLQKKAIAWMESRGDNGVCALETGVGKTLVALAMAQKLIRDGWTDADMDVDPAEYPYGTNGRFLYVSPSRNLLGNMDKEAVSFLAEEGYAVTGSKIDAVVAKGGNSFQSAMNAKPGKDRVKVQRGGGVGEVLVENWLQESKRYIAVFFDEAHEYITKSTGATGRAFLGFKHPRKSVLTASPMTNEPMDAYVLAAVCNNNDLSDTKTEAGKTLRANMREWKERYCETVGGRVVGAKKGDPTVERDLKTWARTNLYFAAKQSVAEPWARPPALEADSKQPGGGTRVLMQPVVEDASKSIASAVQEHLRALHLRFRDRGYIAETKLVIDPETGIEEEIVVPGTQPYPSTSKVRDPKLEQYTQLRLKPLFELLGMLSLAPEMATLPKIDARVKGIVRNKITSVFNAAFPGKKEGDRLFPDLTIADNPKFQQASDILSEALANDPVSGTSRALLWTDDAKMVVIMAKELSKKHPGIHAAALAKEIKLFQSGVEMTRYVHPGGDAEDGWDLPFDKRLYKLYQAKDRHPKKNPGMGRGEQYKWVQFVTKFFIQENRDVRSMTCYGPQYQSGQNFQGFQTVIHMDRDSWNNENMKQRTARAYRQGQKNVVEEHTLDTMYTGAPGPGDVSLDEIRRLHQVMEGAIFDGIVVASQSHPLGTEWSGIQKQLSKYTHIDRKAMQLALAPGSLTAERTPDSEEVK
jgi:hypothetical protein